MDEVNPLVEGEPFSEGNYSAAKSAALDALKEAGFAKAKIRGRALVDRNAATVDVGLFTNPGPKFRFAEDFGDPELFQVDQGLNKFGVKPAQDAWLVDIVRRAIPPGGIYTEKALTKAQQAVFALNVYRVVEVEPIERDSRMGLKITAQPGPYRSLRLGGGVGMDQVQNEIRFQANWKHNNFSWGTCAGFSWGPPWGGRFCPPCGQPYFRPTRPCPSGTGRS